jgi:hypothetical protein
VGDQPFMLGNDLQRDLVMAAPLDPLRRYLYTVPTPLRQT